MSITNCDTHLTRTVRYLSLTFEPVYIVHVNVLSKGKNREQNSSHTMNIGSTLLRTYCLFLFTFFCTEKKKAT